MHPAVVRDTNKEKCPICFMPLSKRKKGEATDDALPAGTVSRVQLSPYRVVLAGVRTAPVDYHGSRGTSPPSAPSSSTSGTCGPWRPA